VREFGGSAVSVTMFGSRVKGDARPNSDYDMIIIIEQLDPNPNVREELVASAIAIRFMSRRFHERCGVVTRSISWN
jgi:predicted nucleotidyltransferase